MWNPWNDAASSREMKNTNCVGHSHKLYIELPNQFKNLIAAFQISSNYKKEVGAQLKHP